MIGVPGDYIEIQDDGKVMVNGQVIEEPYVADFSVGECDIDFPYQVPEGKYFVLGDNRAVSMDSRNSTIGCVSEEQIIGEAWIKMFPFENID